jgi:hypothetical protein
MSGKLTRWEKQLLASGEQIITWEHEEIVDYLIDIFNRDKDDLLLKAASDTTMRHELSITLDYPNCYREGSTNFAGDAVYNKKMRKFTHITYSDKRNYAVYFSITSRATFSAYDFYNSLSKQFPFGLSIKKLTQYLLNN